MATTKRKAAALPVLDELMRGIGVGVKAKPLKTKKQKAAPPARPTLADAIALADGSGIEQAKIAAEWLDVMRERESEAIAYAAAFPTIDISDGQDEAEREVVHTAAIVFGRYAKADSHARRLAVSAGQPLPPTPFLDEFHRRYELRNSTRATSTPNGDGTPRTRKPRAGGSTRAVKEPEGAFYTHDGKVCSRHKFSTVAYFYSLGVEAPGKRMGAKEFKSYLEDQGIDVDTPPWSIKLPNGITLAFHAKGQKVDLLSDIGATPTKGKPPARASKSTAKPAPAKRASKATKKSAPTPRGATKPAAKLTAKKSTQRTASKPVDKIVPRKTVAKKAAAKKRK